MNRDAVMKESFGDAYSTRSNDEGFGGIYGGNEEEGGHKVHGVSAGNSSSSSSYYPLLNRILLEQKNRTYSRNYMNCNF